MTTKLVEIKPENTWGNVIDRLNEIINIIDQDVVMIGDDQATKGNISITGDVNANNVVIHNDVKSDHIVANTTDINNINGEQITGNVITSDQLNVSNTATIQSANVNSLISNNGVFVNVTANTVSINDLTIVNEITTAKIKHLDLDVGIINEADVDKLTVENQDANTVNTAFLYSEKLDAKLISADNLVVNGSSIVQSLSGLTIKPNQIIVSSNTSELTTVTVTDYGLSLLQAKDNSELTDNYVKQSDIGPFASSDKQKIAMTDLAAQGTMSKTTFLRSDGVWAVPDLPKTFGNMNTITYDPNNIGKDVFNIDNISSGKTNTVITHADKQKYDSTYNFYDNVKQLSAVNDRLFWNGNPISDSQTKYVYKIIGFKDLVISKRNIDANTSVSDVAFNINLDGFEQYNNISITVDSVDNDGFVGSPTVINEWRVYYSVDNLVYKGNDKNSYLVFYNFNNSTLPTPTNAIVIPNQSGTGYLNGVNTFMVGYGGKHLGFSLDFYNNPQFLDVRGRGFMFNTSAQHGITTDFQYVSEMSKLFTTPSLVKSLKITMSSLAVVSSDVQLRLTIRGRK